MENYGNVMLGFGGVTTAQGLDRGSRAQYIAFLQDPKNVDIPEDIRAAALSETNRSLRLADDVVFSTKLVDGKTIKMFENQDSKEPGLRNLDKGRLEKNRLFLVCGIRFSAAITFKSGTIRADDESLVKTAKFYPIDFNFSTSGVLKNLAGKVAFAADGAADATSAAASGVSGYTNGIILPDDDAVFSALENGQFTFRSNRKDIVYDFPLSAFKANFHPQLIPTYKLDNPRLIGNNQDMELNIDLGEEVTADNLNTAVWLKVELLGTSTIAI